jgi:hypothetical protein
MLKVSGWVPIGFQTNPLKSGIYSVENDEGREGFAMFHYGQNQWGVWGQTPSQAKQRQLVPWRPRNSKWRSRL